MPDTFGAIQVPAQTTSGVVPPVQAAGDPLLGYTADFLKAVLNAYVLAAWQQVASGKQVVQTVFLDDPTDTVFDENKLPALYVFRDPSIADQKIDWLAEDYREATSTVHVWWVLPMSDQSGRSARSTIMTAIDRVIDQAVERGRDPAWVVAGDTDPQAATQGSLLNRYAGWADFGRTKAGKKRLTIQMLKGEPRRYDMLALEFYCSELLVRDIVADAAADTRLDADFVSPDQGTGLGPRDLGSEHYT